MLFHFSVIRLLNVVYDSNILTVLRSDASRFREEKIASVEVGSEQKISDDNIIAYYPEFDDVDDSEMAAGLLNLHEIFSCAKEGSDESGRTIIPLCRVHHYLEGGFNKGKPIILISDDGEDITVFGKGVPTLAFGVQGCPEFTNRKDGCLRGAYQFTLACILPGQYCAGKDILPP